LIHKNIYKAFEHFVKFYVHLYIQVQERHRKEKETEEEGNKHDNTTDNYLRRPSRSTLENNDWVETCRANCEIHGVEDGIRFCHSLFPQHQPELCRRMSARPVIQINDSSSQHSFIPSPHRGGSQDGEEYDYDEDNEDTGDLGPRTERSFPRPSGPSIIYFDVKLEINAIFLDNDQWGGSPDSVAAPGQCLYMPIKQVSFYNDPEPVGFRGLSCHKKDILTQCYIDCPNNTALNRQLESIQEEEELLDAMNFWMYGSLVVRSAFYLKSDSLVMQC
jgi:hypothetical protein